jgi:hypothetical protein
MSKTKQSDSQVWESDIFVAASYGFELLGDAKKHGGVLRVRQLGTVADAVNFNSRLYPRKVMQDAVERARPRARAGAMLSERVHPEVVATRKGNDAYVDNPDRKTARVDEIEDVSADGSVYIVRTVLDTPEGRVLAQSYRSGRPPGLSTRFTMRGHVRALSDGRKVHVADEMHIHTFDDVDDPAVPQTRCQYELLTDSLRRELGLIGPPSPNSGGAGVSRLSHLPVLDGPLPPETGGEGRSGNLVARDSSIWAAKGKRIMNEKIKRALASLNLKIARRASVDEVVKARGVVADAIEEASVAGEDIGEATGALAQADATIALAGYNSDRPGPSAVTFNNSGANAGDPAMEAEIERHVACLTGLTDSQRQFVADVVRRKAANGAQVGELVRGESEAMQKLLADSMLQMRGLSGGRSGAAGQTTRDGASPTAQLLREAAPKWQQDVDKILAAADQTGKINPQSHRMSGPERKRLREYNRKHFIEPLIEDIRTKHAQSRDGNGFAAAIDTCMGGMDSSAIDRALSDSIGRARASYDSTTLSNMYNQPTIAMAILIQSFQDLEMLQFVEGIGPTAPTTNRGGWDTKWGSNGQVGSVLRVPVELYVEPGNGSYGQFVGPGYDAGFVVPEGIGIPEIQVVTNWLPFAPVWRRIAAAATRDVIKAMGNGPLNYDVIGRHLYHMTYAKNRAIDKAIGDEMLLASDEFGAVSISGETVSGANNSSYNASGGVTVNLNPAKAANATVATSDPSVTYGSNVKGAVRLTCQGAGGSTGGAGSAAPYFGSSVWGATPVVMPRVVRDLTQQGVYTSTTSHPLTVTAPSSMVQGYLDGTGTIQTLPGGGSAATFAVDYQNSVVVFASGVSGSSGAITTTVTVSYSYATNFNSFSVLNPTIPSGQTLAQYKDGLLELHDTVAATMGSAPRYVKPNLALMSLNASVNLTTASLFFKFNSPDGTELFPTENYFYQRTGVRGARHNTPWYAGDRRILFGLEGATKYAIDSPFEARGPYPKYDGSGSIVATDLYYAEENSCICTPQVVDQSGNTVNPAYMSVLLY